MENLSGKQGVLGEPVVWNSSGGGAMMEKQEMKQNMSAVARAQQDGALGAEPLVYPDSTGKVPKIFFFFPFIVMNLLNHYLFLSELCRRSEGLLLHVPG